MHAISTIPGRAWLSFIIQNQNSNKSLYTLQSLEIHKVITKIHLYISDDDQRSNRLLSSLHKGCFPVTFIWFFHMYDLEISNII